MSAVWIRSIQETDQAAVLAIYQEGLDGRLATFETELPDWEEWLHKYHDFCRLAAICEATKLVAWASLSPVSKRACYSGVAEVSIYVASAYHGRGIGKQLLQALVDCSRQHGIWTLQASIFPENQASIHIHEAVGFRQMGYREKIAKLDGQWRDTVILERRNPDID